MHFLTNLVFLGRYEGLPLISVEDYVLMTSVTHNFTKSSDFKGLILLLLLENSLIIEMKHKINLQKQVFWPKSVVSAMLWSVVVSGYKRQNRGIFRV